MNIDLIKGNEFFEKNDFVKAFDEYNKVVDNCSLVDADDIAEAYNMLGLISVIETRVDTLDETGLFYFKKALEFNPENISALTNIINCFGDYSQDHKDIEITKIAIKKLNLLNFKFSNVELEKINKIMKI